MKNELQRSKRRCDMFIIKKTRQFFASLENHAFWLTTILFNGDNTLFVKYLAFQIETTQPRYYKISERKCVNVLQPTVSDRSWNMVSQPVGWEPFNFIDWLQLGNKTLLVSNPPVLSLCFGLKPSAYIYTISFTML